MRRHLAPMRLEPMLEQIDALPRTEREATVDKRNRKLHGGQCSADVRWHVVRPLVAMAEELVAIDNEPGEETFEVSAHVRIGILLHDETGGSMANKECQQTAFHAALRRPVGD